MSDIAELGYFKVTGAGYGVGADTLDAGSFPDAYAINCDVWLRPRLVNVSATQLSVIANDRKALLFLAPVKALLLNGNLKLSKEPPKSDGTGTSEDSLADGLYLVADTAGLKLPEGAFLVYDVEFGTAQVAGSTVKFDKFTFRAPTEHLAEIDLADVERINTPPSLGTTYTLRMLPDDWDMSDDGELRFFANGVQLGTDRVVNIDDIVGDRLDTAVGGLNDTKEAAIVEITAAVGVEVDAQVPPYTAAYIEALEAHAEDVGAGNAKLVIGGVDGPTFPGYPAPWSGIVGKPMFYVNDYPGADPTGATLSDGAIAAAVAARGDNPGTIVFGGGTYKYSVGLVDGPYQSTIGGSGKQATILRYIGTGDALRVYDPRSAGSAAETVPGGTAGPGWGGQSHGLIIDGSDAGPSACGLHIGDITGAEIDIAVINFPDADQRGVWFDNRVTWCEGTKIKARTENCKQAVDFGVNGGATSFGYGQYDFFVIAYANQNGVHVGDDSLIYNLTGSGLTIGGGFFNNSDDDANTGIVLHLSDTATVDCHGSINVESNGEAGYPGHRTIVRDGGNIHFDGNIDFRNGPIPFSNGSGVSSQIVLSGPRLNIDATLGRMCADQHAKRVYGGSTGSIGFMSSTGAWFPFSGNWFYPVLASGANTVTINYAAGVDPAYTQAASFDFFLQQPASGAASTLTWPGSFVWADGAPPILSSVHGAVDHIHVTTADFNTYFAEHVNAAKKSRGITTNASALVPGGLNLYTGSSTHTGTLPAVSTAVGLPVVVKNFSSGALTVNRTGSDAIYHTSSTPVSSLTVAPGASVTLIGDGYEWAVVAVVGTVS